MTQQFLPNTFGLLGKRIHVAQGDPRALDTNAGTLDAPLKTIGAAMPLVRTGDCVLIDEGVYREEIILPVSGHPYVPTSQVHFQAVEGKQVFIKGSDLFETEWTPAGRGIFIASLPAHLFEEGAWNPYRLSLADAKRSPVRPCVEDEMLPETLGQLYVNGHAFRQAQSREQLARIPNSFLVSADGASILVNSHDGELSAACIELTIRQRCIRPTFEGPVFAQFVNIAVEHAAEPGPFCKARAESLRIDSRSGVEVRKTFCVAGSTGNHGNLMAAQPGYRSLDQDTIIASIIDDTTPMVFTEQECVSATSNDGGKSWIYDEATRMPLSKQEAFNYVVDPENGALLRHYRSYPHGLDPHGAFGSIPHQVMLDISHDGGMTWSKPSLINEGKCYFASILPLDDGSFVWPYTTSDLPPAEGHHSRVGTLLGRWANDTIEWEQGGGVQVLPEESHYGLHEPSIAQFKDGRLIGFFRQGSRLPSQDSAGCSSLKLFSVSEDGGRTWASPRPLAYDDGRIIYSPRSFHTAFRSIKNGKVYIVMNIATAPCWNCDPRTHLYLVEVDANTLGVDRDRVTLIEAKHSEHHELVRFSNFQMLQERRSGNPVVFMKLDKSEFCPIWRGYDVNLYRYELSLATQD